MMINTNISRVLRLREVRGVSSSSLTKRNCIDSLRESGLRALRNDDASGGISKKLLRASAEVEASVGDSAKAISRSVAICLAWARDGSVFACGHGDHTIRVYDQRFQFDVNTSESKTTTIEGGAGVGESSRPLAVLGSSRQGSSGDRRDEKTRTTWSLSFHPHRSDVLVSGALAFPIDGGRPTSSSSCLHGTDNIYKKAAGQQSTERVSASTFEEDDDNNDDNDNNDDDDDDDYYEPEDLVHTRNSFGASQRRLDSQQQKRRSGRRSSSNLKQKRLALADSVRLVSNDNGEGLSVDKAFTVPEMEADISIWHWPTGSKLFSTRTLGGNVFSVKFSPCGSCVLAAVGASLQVWAYADESCTALSSNNRRQSRVDSDSALLHDSDAATIINDAIYRATKETASLFSNTRSCSSFSSTTTSLNNSAVSLSVYTPPSSTSSLSSTSITTTTLPLVHFGFNVRSLGFAEEEDFSTAASFTKSPQRNMSNSSVVRVVVALQRSYDDGLVDTTSSAFGTPSSPSSPSPEQSIGGNLMMFMLDVPLLRALIRRHNRIQLRAHNKSPSSSSSSSTSKINEWIAPSFSPPPSHSSSINSSLPSSSVHAAPWLRPIVPPNLALGVSRAISREIDAGERSLSDDPEDEEEVEEEEEEEEEEEQNYYDDVEVAERNLISFCGTMDESDDHLSSSDEEDESCAIEEEERNDDDDDDGGGTKRRRRSSLPHEQVTEALLSSYVTSIPAIFGPRMVRRLLLSHTHVASRGLNGYYGVSESSNDRKLNFGPCPLLGPVLISRRALIYGDGSLSIGAVRLSMSGERIGAAFVSTPLTANSQCTDSSSSISSLSSSSFDLKSIAAKRTEHLTSNERLSATTSPSLRREAQVVHVVVNQIKLEEDYIGRFSQVTPHQSPHHQTAHQTAPQLRERAERDKQQQQQQAQQQPATSTSGNNTASLAPLLPLSSTSTSATNPFSFPLSLKSLFGLGSTTSTSGSTSAPTSAASAAAASAAAASSLSANLLVVSQSSMKIPPSSAAAVTNVSLPSASVAQTSYSTSNPTPPLSSSSSSPQSIIHRRSTSFTDVSACLTPTVGIVSSSDPQLNQSQSSRKRSIAEVANLSDRRWSSLSGNGSSRGVSFSSQNSSSLVALGGCTGAEIQQQTGPRKLSGATRTHPSILRNSFSSTIQTRQSLLNQQQLEGGSGNIRNCSGRSIIINIGGGSNQEIAQRHSRGGSFTSDIANSSAESVATNSDNTLSVAADAFEVDTDLGTNVSSRDLSVHPRRSHHVHSSPPSNLRKGAQSLAHNYLAGVSSASPSLSSVSISANTFDRERESSGGSVSTLANALNSLAISELRSFSKNGAASTRLTCMNDRGRQLSHSDDPTHSVKNRLINTRKSRPVLIVNDDVLPDHKLTLDPEREEALELATRFLLVSLTQRLLHWHLSENNRNVDSTSALIQQLQQQQLHREQLHQHHQHFSSSSSSSSLPSSSPLPPLVSKATVFIREIQLPHLKWARTRVCRSASYGSRRRLGRLSQADTTLNEDLIDSNTSFTSALSGTRHVFRFGRVVSALPVGAGINVTQITTVQLSPLGGHVMLAVEGVERKTTVSSSPTALVGGATSASASTAVRSLMRIFSSSSSSSNAVSTLPSSGSTHHHVESMQTSRRSRLLIRTISLASGDPSLEISMPSEWTGISSTLAQTSSTTATATSSSQNTSSTALQLFKERMFSVNVAAWAPLPSPRGGGSADNYNIRRNSAGKGSPLVGIALATQGGLVLLLNA